MSLNGLDDERVKEAHQAAVAEPGGWFLLKYVSRDEIELLGRGSGGIVEIRNGVAQYDEPSPLFGFLRYRRRNVVIKYLPEECSRLVQARASVHFNSFCERFSPYDTDFEITNAKELKDTKLSAACSLHAASGSTSSSTSSLRRRRLMEITEEEEEEERERKRQSTVKEEDQSGSPGGQEGLMATPSVVLQDPEPPITLNANLAGSPEASRFTDSLDPPSFIGAPRPASPAKSLDDAARRMSSQSARPDIYSTSSYPYGKPRVKLAPRPSADLSGRPLTSAGAAVYRPVSSIPAGLKTLLSKSGRKGRSQDKDLDEDDAESPIVEETDISLGTLPSISEPTRPHTSSGAHAVVTPAPAFLSNMPALPPAPSKQNTMTPEKARLLKAMKLREKKKMELQTKHDEHTVEAPSDLSSPSLPERDSAPETPATDPKENDEVEVEAGGLLENRLSISKADSGVDVGADQASVDTHMDSHPTSPFAASDMGDSTQASSLSESTDETVLASKEHDLPNWSEDGKYSVAASSPRRDEHEPTDGAEPTEELVKEVEPESDFTAHETQSEESSTDGEAVAGSQKVEEADGKEVERELDGEKESKVEPLMEFPEHGTEKDSDTLASLGGEGAPAPAVQTLPISKFSSAPSVSSPAEKEGSSRPTAVKSARSVETRLTDDAVEGDLARPLQLRIPFSKFSTQEGKSPTSPINRQIPSIVTHMSQDREAEERALSKEIDVENADVLETASIETRRSKRIAALEPIRTDIDGPEKDKRHSMASLFDDDGLMDELQSATVQQAKPVTVSKSPMTPFFSSDAKTRPPGPDSGFSTPRFVRTVSNPIRGPLLAPGDVTTSSARAVSSGAAYLHKIAQQQAADLRPKSSKIGSSISQRIKALEKLSANTSPVSGETVVKERPASTFFSVRKTSGREPSRSPSVVDRATSLTRGPTPSPPESRESSPETGKKSFRDRSGSLVNRLSMFEGGKMPRGRPESVQVTARIVRDATQPFSKAPEPKADAADFGPLDLKQSPLVVDVKKSPFPSLLSSSTPVPEQEPALEKKQSLLQRRFSKGRRSESRDRNKDIAKEEDKEVADTPRLARRRSSLTVVKDFIKDRRDNLLGAKSPSTDNLSITLSSATANLASPSGPTPTSRSPSRPPSVHQSLSFPRRLSISSRRSSLEQSSPVLSGSGLPTGPLSPSRTTEASGESDGGVRDKRSGSSSSNPGSISTSPTPGNGTGSNNNSSSSSNSSSNSNSRTSRFMRRLSSSLGSSKKSVPPSISPTVAEEEDAEVVAASIGVPQSRGNATTGAPSSAPTQPSIVAFMGDVNVQFPDNLLWKRRTICLDSQGFLILSAVQGAAAMPTAVAGKDRHHPVGTIKRYHMSDFRLPYNPEMEVQELPNSVVLDFVDGSGLQIACEDRAGQMNVLHILQKAHQSHTSFGL
ncbi:hypothetical protein B0H63DRAFT_273046 [Podospora didyma]|uniref:ADF-H domain-containing protein n=1 Tax=Podospora didyma TaxID=330526 RepID=A0AAE0KEB9_9PEZI|nr:hypothetical protein B0H63DRAFT_273046 [Podospora didyma]